MKRVNDQGQSNGQVSLSLNSGSGLLNSLSNAMDYYLGTISQGESKEELRVKISKDLFKILKR
jgi:hypothetical protein